MQFDEALDQRQAQSKTAARPVEGGVGLGEGLEDARDHLPAQADPGVPDGNHGHVLLSGQGHRSVAAPFAELGCVVQQVAQHLGQSGSVAIDPKRGIGNHDF